MPKHKFSIKGLEVIEKQVYHFKGTGSRVYVPREWKKVAVVRLE